MLPKKQGPPTRTVTKGFDRSKYSQSLAQRTQEAFDKKDSSGKFGSYIKDEFQNRMWNCSEGDHTIDIIPYIVGSSHPTLNEGDIAFLLDVYRHGNVGPNEDSFICLSRSFNQPCPICEDQREKRRDGQYSDDDLKPLNPSRRNIYNIWVHDNDKELNKGVQLWEVAQWYFDKHVSARAKKSKTGELINYPDPINGKAIQFERKGKGAKNTEYLAHTFVDRDWEISEEILRQAIPLDQIIKIPTYDEVYQAHFGTAPKTTSEEDDISMYPSPKKPLTKTPVKQEVVQETTEEEGCPYGGKFGVDINNYEECSECPRWDDCSEEEKRLKEPETSKKPSLLRRK